MAVYGPDETTKYLPVGARYEDVNLCNEPFCRQWVVSRCQCCAEAYCPEHLHTVTPADSGEPEQWCQDCRDHGDVVLA